MRSNLQQMSPLIGIGIVVVLDVISSAAGQSLPAPVVVINSFPLPAPDAFVTNLRFGPEGLLYGWDGQKVWQQTGVNADSFGLPAFGTVPSNGSDAGPINFSQNGQTIIIGNGSGGQDFTGTSSGLLYTTPATGGAATLVGSVPFHQDLIPVPAPSTIAGAATKFLVDRGSADFATSGIDLFDFVTGKVVPLIQNIPGASSSIAFDSAGRLYVGIGFGASRGQIRRFTLPLVDLAAADKPLDWTAGQLFNSADNNSGAGMFFDARGNLFVGGPNGATVFNPNGGSQFYSTGASSFPIVMYNATNDQFALTLNGFNDPQGLGFSPRIYRAADFEVPAVPVASWKVTSGGTWSIDANWDTASPPNAIDARAALGPVITAPRTIEMNGPVTLGSLSFAGLQAYRLAGPGPLTMQLSTTIASIQSAGASHMIAVPLVLASDTEVTVAGATDALTLSSGTSGPGMLSKVGAGTLIITGPNTYSGNTAVDDGKLMFNIATGTPSIGSATTVTVAPGATLELAGSISALGSSTGARAHVINDSPTGGVLISGQHQIVGAIDGSGQTTIATGSDLTANHIIQSALVISGGPTSLATLTIAASDETGSPLMEQRIGAALVNSQVDPLPLARQIGAMAEAGTIPTSIAPQDAVGAVAPAVPEATALTQALLVLGALAIRFANRRIHRR